MKVIMQVINLIQLSAYAVFLMMVSEIVAFKFLSYHTINKPMLFGYMFYLVSIFVFQMIYTKTYKYFDLTK